MRALLIGSVGAFIVGLGTGHWITGNYYQGEIASAERSALTKRLEAVAEERVKREAVEQALQTAEAAYLSTLQAKNDELQALNDRLAAGDSGLFISADCPADGMPETSETERRNTATIARLSRQSEQWYIRHRQLAERYEATLTLCQDYVRKVQAQFTF